MKKIILLLFLLATINVFGQDSLVVKHANNTIVVTPLGDLFNDSKSSIYYKRLLAVKSDHYISLRLGTELFNSIKHKYASGLEKKSKSYNVKMGLELGKSIKKLSIYYGGELSYSRMQMNGVSLIPSEGAIFHEKSIEVEEDTRIDKTTLSLISIIGFVGLNYEIAKSLKLGIESGLGLGFYKSDQKYYDFISLKGETHKGRIHDLSVNRFITLEYSF